MLSTLAVIATLIDCAHRTGLYLLLLQDVSRVDRERQRAAQQVQQLQGHLTAMRAEQDALRKRLHERLLSQEKAAAERSKEMAALRRAGKGVHSARYRPCFWLVPIVVVLMKTAFGNQMMVVCYQ